MAIMWDVSSGNTASCGRCNMFPASYWLAKQWEGTKLLSQQPLPREMSPGSGQILQFICGRCSRVFPCEFRSVSCGNTQSCGKCSWKTRETWLLEAFGFLTLDSNQSLPDEWAPGNPMEVWFSCRCGTRKNMKFCYAAYGDALSCGCLVIGQSELSPSAEIFRWVKQLLPQEEIIQRWRDPTIENREIDIYLPQRKLGIEYHGLIWHSEFYSKKECRDHQKFLLAKKAGIRLIQVYEDEWAGKSNIIKAQLQGILAPFKAIRIRPKFELVTEDTPVAAREFLTEHHYLGAASGRLTVISRHEDRIVGVWVFMKRESGVVLWHRACWNHSYKAWNPHEKALRLALLELKKMGFTRMVTFSDNRFHTGELYEKLGFSFEAELPPGYSYTDLRGKRKSKYVFRVVAGVDEARAAAVKGWYRIWDSGKRRYSLNLSDYDI
jgi:hypothetical protein